jgi:fructose-1,6-bisphosphatase/inositol monophosphatase family enzyme
MDNLSRNIKEMLIMGFEVAKSSNNSGKGTGEINTNGEETIELDKILENLYIDYIKKNNLPWNIFSEEVGWVKFHPNPEYTIAFDPLDGSANYKFGNNLLPYGTLMAVYRGVNPKIGDVLASGAMDFTTEKGYVFDGNQTKDFDNNKIVIKNDWQIDRTMPVNFDLYWKKSYDLFSPLAEKIHIRWCGSVVGSLMYLLEGASAVMGAPCLKPEEVGAVTSLVLGAGGVVDWTGEMKLAEQSFDTDKKYGLIGGGEKVVDFVVGKLD